MPFYEYECTSCKFYTEVMQKITDRPLKKCPSCGRNTLRKLVSAPNFRLKGGGWYETDFKSDKEARRNLAEADKSESKGAGAAETAKPAETAGAASETKSAPAPSSAVTVSAPAGRARAKAAAPRRTVKTKSTRRGSGSAKPRSARKARR